MNKLQKDGMMDQAAGLGKKIAGSVEAGVGNVTGSDKMQAEGAAKKAEGQVQQSAGDAQKQMGNVQKKVTDTLDS